MAIVAATVTLAIGAAGMGATLSHVAQSDAELIASNVLIADVPVGGLSPADAREKIRPWAQEKMAAPITLRAPRSGRTWNIALAEMGGRFDLQAAVEEAAQVGKDGFVLARLVERWQSDREPITITPTFLLDENKVTQRLEKIGEEIRVRPKSARARMDAGGQLIVSEPERKGIRLDVAATQAALLRAGEDALREGGQADLVIAEERPRITQSDLGQVSTLLGSFTTGYGSSSSDRRHNVEKAASHINGTLLAPGAVFSYNDTVGPRTIREGWNIAHQYQNGRVVDGVGGGVCQPSSTLYNAVLLSGLKIVQRANHSMPVAYVRPGRDATVSYGAIDLQFENSTDKPIYVAASGARGRLTMAIYGSADAKKSVQIISGPRVANPKGGFTVSTWREVDGRREKLSTDYYRPPAPKTVAAAPLRRRPAAARRTATAAKPAAVAPTPATAASPPPAGRSTEGGGTL